MVGVESKGRGKGRGTYSVGICEDAWKRMGEITPGRYEHATCRRRETGVADDLEECQ
jgi:hypothetical protein